MATKIIKKNKVIFTNPIVSKTVYPFIIRKFLREGVPSGVIDLNTINFVDCGRLYRPIKPNVFFNANVIVQCRATTEDLIIKCEVQLADGVVLGPKVVLNTITANKGFRGYKTFNIFIANTFNNTEMMLNISAINAKTILPSYEPGYIDLAYIEKEE